MGRWGVQHTCTHTVPRDASCDNKPTQLGSVGSRVCSDLLVKSHKIPRESNIAVRLRRGQAQSEALGRSMLATVNIQ